MKKTTVKINGSEYRLPVYSHAALVVGSGAAGLNCVDLLYTYGVTDTALVTEGFNMGTSRNTGSDKQTYYKLTLSGGDPDSVRGMAETLFEGGCMHGDLALCEAAGSAGAFFRLCGLGVPFPYNEYGEYAGYKTDHDPRARATSCGPLTSHYMTDALSKSVRAKGLPIYDGYRVISVLKNGAGEAAGVLAVSTAEADSEANPLGLCLMLCSRLVWATGGPSAIYAATVYPESQTCAHGAAFAAGAEGVNLSESQYGIASVKFRWNLSGTYQQVVPRYISTDEKGGDVREFLADCPSFNSPGDLFTSIFLKGYQWPFDPRRAVEGSSRIDMAVFAERMAGRRVFIDFTRNPAGFDLSLLSDEAYTYLEKSGALFGTPIERLAKMNTPAIELYASHGIDLYTEPLEIDVCAQHNNGGLGVNTDYESTTLPRFFAVGECAGVFGIRRPGGSALNCTQVSSNRAARRIAADSPSAPDGADFTLPALPYVRLPIARDETEIIKKLLTKRLEYGRRMTKCGAFIRNLPEIKAAIAQVRGELEGFAADPENVCAGSRSLVELSINYDILLTQLVYLSAIAGYIEGGGLSRGSYLVNGSPECDEVHSGEVICARLDPETLSVELHTDAVRPIPDSEQWFETVYNRFLGRE